jgi:uncharacterized protein (TIGR02466 family)
MTIFNLTSVPVYQNTTNHVPTAAEISTVNRFELQSNDFNYFSKDFNVLDHENLSTVKKIINSHLLDYQHNVCGIEIQQFYITDSWIAVTPPGGKHIVHNHPNSLLSGVFYFSVPDQSSINFYVESQIFKNFKFCFDYTKLTAHNRQTIKVPVQQSDIVIFPSWVNHSVDVNTSDRERIIIGFNCFVQGNFGNDRYPTRLFLK